MDTTPRSTVEGLEIRTAGSETIVHDTAHEKLHVLNGTAARILTMCDGAHSPEGIATEISADTGAPYDVVLRDVRAVLEQFSQLQLLR